MIYDKKVVQISNIPVEIVRKDVKNIGLHITRDGKVQMTVSPKASEKLINDFLKKSQDWVVKHYRQANEKIEKERKLRNHTFQEGETYTIWGKPYNLHIVENAEDDSAYIESDKLIVTLTHTIDKKAIQRLINRYYLTKFQNAVYKDIDELLPIMEEVPVNEVRFKNMTSRWGSCIWRERIVCFNIRLIFYPRECTRAVVVHELCHLKEANHGPHFHALMDHYMPDHKVWNKYLK